MPKIKEYNNVKTYDNPYTEKKDKPNAVVEFILNLLKILTCGCFGSGKKANDLQKRTVIVKNTKTELPNTQRQKQTSPQSQPSQKRNRVNQTKEKSPKKTSKSTKKLVENKKEVKKNYHVNNDHVNKCEASEKTEISLNKHLNNFKTVTDPGEAATYADRLKTLLKINEYNFNEEEKKEIEKTINYLSLVSKSRDPFAQADIQKK